MKLYRFFTLILFLSATHSKVMRNNALITKMVSNFPENNETSEPDKENEAVLLRMQVVLCKNFPTIPCELITQDKTLKRLINKSIQQINEKKQSLDKTIPFPGYLTLFPTLNNDDLSNFIQISDAINRQKEKKHNHKKKVSTGNMKVNPRTTEKRKHDGHKKIIKNKAKRTYNYNRKKLRKFYPHKVKYAEKNNRNGKEFGDITSEKLSMSVEDPDMPLTRQHHHFTYRVEPENSPVWRIDYTKHGQPTINLFDYDADSRKITKTGTNVWDGNEQRKDFKRSDVFVNNNFVKTNDVSDDID